MPPSLFRCHFGVCSHHSSQLAAALLRSLVNEKDEECHILIQSIFKGPINN